MRMLASRVDRIARELAPAAGVHVWLPADDERDDGMVRHVRTGEVVPRAEADRRPGRQIVVEYAEGPDWRAP